MTECIHCQATATSEVEDPIDDDTYPVCAADAAGYRTRTITKAN